MNLLIRTDANLYIGTGHLMRCMAIAQAWQNNDGQVIFAIATPATPIETRLASEGMDVVRLSVEPGSAEDARQTASLAQKMGATWVVVDGYHFGSEYQQIIKDSELSLLFIDDYGHARDYWADFVLNQNIYAHESLYPNRSPDTQLLLGTRYTLLRREFLRWQGWRREIPEVARKVLVTLGGSDPDNVTLKVIQALQLVEIEKLEVVVVVGGSNPHFEQLQAAVEELRFPISLKRNVMNMPELMARADLAIAAGGSTAWELAFMGLPSILLVLADNQRAIAQKLGRMGVAIDLGWHRDVGMEEIAETIARSLESGNRRREMAASSQKLVDGEGSARVLMRLEGRSLRLRVLGEADCQLLWEWANDPEVRALSFSSEPIPQWQHVQWFKTKLSDPNCLIYLAIDRDDIPIGQIRYEIENNEAVVSVSIDRQFRNRGYGSTLIQLASQQAFHIANLARIHAYIKPVNQASIRAFVKANFINFGISQVKGAQAVHLCKERE